MVLLLVASAPHELFQITRRNPPALNFRRTNLFQSDKLTYALLGEIQALRGFADGQEFGDVNHCLPREDGDRGTGRNPAARTPDAARVVYTLHERQAAKRHV